jgi:SAM-dependent methyltransferase
MGMSLKFPDHSAQEVSIRRVGDAELLYKRGRKIVRYKQGTWGAPDEDIVLYRMLAPYIKGRVINVGLGAGTSLDMIMEKSAEITEVFAYEIIQDLVDLYAAEHPSLDPKRKLEVADARDEKPAGTFDSILFELQITTQREYDDALAYLTWAERQLNDRGYIILSYNNNTDILAKTFRNLNITYLSTGTGLGERKVWIILQKTLLIE